ncbi:hypothetical protein [Pseudomonas sp. W5-36]|uniref:hypothetical protein n=1 Tax=Pseudomonas sp. W5-36 TaxID=3097455 RepID=UPI0039792E7E
MAEASSCTSNSSLQWTAFYGDPQLAQFYFNRLRWHAKAGQLLVSRQPTWSGGKGTISSAMVHSTDPEIFERMTGLPYSLAMLLEMLQLTSSNDIDFIADALPAGTATHNIAAHVMRDWFADPACRWSELINDKQVDDLRLEWIAACEKWLTGQNSNDATELNQRMRALLRPKDAMSTVQNTVLESLIALSPPPPTNSAGRWRSITLGRGVHSKFMVAQFALGWTTSDFAKETELFQWFTERQKQEPGGQFTEATLKVAQEEWSLLPKDHDYIAKEEYFFEHINSALAPINERLRNIVRRHLKAGLCPPEEGQISASPRTTY